MTCDLCRVEDLITDFLFLLEKILSLSLPLLEGIKYCSTVVLQYYTVHFFHLQVQPHENSPGLKPCQKLVLSIVISPSHFSRIHLNQ